MTDMLDAYLTHRGQGHAHWAACLALARRFDLDKATINRIIDRAERGAQAGGGLSEKFPRLSSAPEPSFARAEIRTSGGHG